MKQTPQKSSKTDDNSPWMKWAYVGIALLFAVAMVGTYMSPLFSNTQKVQAGNTVQIGYTIRNEAGRTLITTDQNLASSEYEKGNVVLLTSGMEIPAGAQVSGEDIVVLPVLYPNVTGYSGFGLIGFEVDAISEGLVGMRTGETKTVSLSYGTNDLEMNLSEEDATGLGLNFTEIAVGDLVPLGFMTSPEISLENETDEAPALRLGTVVAKTSDSLVIMHRYGSAEITLNAITG